MNHRNTSTVHSKQWALTSLVLMLLAGLVFMFQPASAHAVPGTDAAGFSISIEKADATHVHLRFTNTSSLAILSASGTSVFPADVVAYGQKPTVTWEVGPLAKGASTLVVNKRGDKLPLTVELKEVAGKPAKPSNPAQPAKPSSSVKTSKPSTTVPKSRAKIIAKSLAPGKAQQPAKPGNTLSQTGSEVLGFALLAAALVSLGFSLTRHNGRIAVRVGTGIVGTLALLAAAGLIAIPAHAAQRDVSGSVTSSFTYGPEGSEKTYTVDSTATLVFDDPTTQTSLEYAKAMGPGWNLGNTFDGITTKGDAAETCDTPDKGETAWGNPRVTHKLIDNIAAHGFKTIRMPFTAYCRISENKVAKPGEIRYVIRKEWLTRYKQVVDWAVADGMYVVINVHHDSWLWLNSYNGTKEKSTDYQEFSDIWRQLASTFANEPSTVIFETLNEPQFKNAQGAKLANNATTQKLLDDLNTDAYKIIRTTPGNETRMILIPSLGCSWEGDASFNPSTAASTYIQSLKDPHVLATVHYYSQWVYSANLGREGFDEKLWTDNRTDTPRSDVDRLASTIKTNFTDHGIGTVVGEFGLLGYDAGDNVLETGEEIKYYDYVEAVARQNGFSPIFWDNGSGINRTKNDGAQWKQLRIGAAIDSSIKGNRQSSAVGFDRIFLTTAPASNITIPLRLNGNTFESVSVDGRTLAKGSDYTYDAQSATLSLSKAWVDRQYAAHKGTGQFADLALHFNAGADWHEYLIHRSDATVAAKAGQKLGIATDNNGVTIPLTFTGNALRRVTVYETGADGKPVRVGPNSSWWNWLQNGGSFTVSDTGLTLVKSFFDDGSVKKPGKLTVHVTFYGNVENDDGTGTQTGQQLDIPLNLASDGTVTLAASK